MTTGQRRPAPGSELMRDESGLPLPLIKQGRGQGTSFLQGNVAEKGEERADCVGRGLARLGRIVLQRGNWR